MEIIRNSTRLDRKVYKKPTDIGFLLHYYSPVDMKYTHSLLKTIEWIEIITELSREMIAVEETMARLSYKREGTVEE